MNLSDTVRELSRELKISLAEIARRVGQSPQNLSKKMNKNTLSFDEFEQILKCLGVGMEVTFTLPGGRTSLGGGNDERLRTQMKILEMQLDVERMKNKYFSDISYQYRTALNTVSGGLELARNHVKEPDRVLGCFDKMIPAVEELTGLIEDSPFNREAGIQLTIPEDPALEKNPIKKVLLVDDNDINREIVSGLLEDSGIEVEEAANGSESVDLILARPSGYYDLILMDLLMPVMDGYAATRRIRKIEGADAASLPIIAMTASVSGDERRAAEKAGMTGFMEKPLNLDKFFSLLKNLSYKHSSVVD